MNPNKFSYKSMGTSWEVTIWDKIPEKTRDKIKTRVIASTNEFDSVFSRFKKNSLVSEISKQKGRIKVPKDFTRMLEVYKNLYKLSDKTLTPLIGVVLSEMGYDANYSLRPKNKFSVVPDFDQTVKIPDDETVETTRKVLFDFGALGKGYFVDKIGRILKDEGLKSFLVNGSGDIYYQGGVPIKVGLEHPSDPTKVIGALSLKKGSVCASGTNRRKWETYNHIINPKTLSPATDIIATWVMSDTAAIADALATALFLCPPENFLRDYKFEYLILNKDYKVKRSKGFDAELF